MKEYDYKAIPYKERLTTLCGIAPESVQCDSYRYPAVCQQISCDKRHGGTLNKGIVV